MSVRAARRLLWLTLFLLAPLPILFLGPGLVPPGSLVMFGAIPALVAVLEHARGTPPILAAVFWVQALIWAVPLWLVAWSAARALGHLSPRTRARTTLALMALCVILAASFEIYRTPYGAHSSRTSLLHLYE